MENVSHHVVFPVGEAAPDHCQNHQNEVVAAPKKPLNTLVLESANAKN